MFDLKKRLPACAVMLVIYGVMYLLSSTLFSGAEAFAFVTGSTILLCAIVNLVIVLFENPVAGIISAVGYPFAVIFGSMFGVLNEPLMAGTSACTSSLPLLLQQYFISV